MKSLEIKHSPVNISNKTQKYYPSASFDAKAIPELKDAKDGTHHHILIKFKKTGSNSDNNKTSIHGDMVAAEYQDQAKSDKDAEEGADNVEAKE